MHAIVKWRSQWLCVLRRLRCWTAGTRGSRVLIPLGAWLDVLYFELVQFPVQGVLPNIQRFTISEFILESEHVVGFKYVKPEKVFHYIRIIWNSLEQGSPAICRRASWCPRNGFLGARDNLKVYWWSQSTRNFRSMGWISVQFWGALKLWSDVTLI